MLLKLLPYPTKSKQDAKPLFLSVHTYMATWGNKML